MRRRTALALIGTTAAVTTVGWPAVASAANSTGEVTAPTTLKNGDQIVSPNGRTRLVMQADGNAVVYAKDDTVLWNSGIRGSTGARLVVQTDGGLVIYKATENVVVKVLRTGGGGVSSRKLSVQNDGNVVFYSTAGQALWSTSTVTKPIDYVDYVAAGTEMAYGDSLRSLSGQYRLVMQSDGNLVLYTSGNQVLFSSYTSGENCRFVPQSDGNLVIYDAANRVLWQTQTRTSAGGAKLTVQNDGNIVFYQSDGVAGYRSSTYATSIIAGESLQPEHYLSNNGFKAIMQGDGNFVIYKNGAVWQTQTNSAGSIASMQADGNFVVRNGDTVSWHSATDGRQGKRVTLEPDGRLVMYRSDGAGVWNNITGTAVPTTWQLPFEGRFTVTTEFQVRDSAHPNGHRGIDWGLGANWPQRAISDGTVLDVSTGHTNQDGSTYGNYVEIEHADGVKSLLGHLISGSPIVTRGQRVTRGQVIGYTGNTGLSYGNHCHLSMWQNGNLIDPRLFFESRSIAVE